MTLHMPSARPAERDILLAGELLPSHTSLSVPHPTGSRAYSSPTGKSRDGSHGEHKPLTLLSLPVLTLPYFVRQPTDYVGHP